MKAITANRLTDGRVVYRHADGTWTPTLNHAAQYKVAAAERVLATALRDEGTVVGAYLIDVEATAPTGQKVIRETIRLTGPSAGSLHRAMAGA